MRQDRVARLLLILLPFVFPTTGEAWTHRVDSTGEQNAIRFPPAKLATGPDNFADGYLEIASDEYGSWGGFGGLAYEDLFKPANAALETVGFTSGFFLMVPDRAQRELLSDMANWQDVHAPDASLTRSIAGLTAVVDSNGDGVPDTMFSSFDVQGGATDLSFDLEQAVSAISPGVAGMRQDYTITNNSTSAIDFDMVRVFDGDLLWDGDFTNDEVGTTTHGSGYAYVFMQEAAVPGSTAITLSCVDDGDDGDDDTGDDGNNPCGCVTGSKAGVEPENGLPAYGLGTDVLIWDNFGLPETWMNDIANVGFLTNGTSGGAPQDAAISQHWSISLEPGETKTVNLLLTYGQNTPGMEIVNQMRTDRAFYGLSDQLIATVVVNAGDDPAPAEVSERTRFEVYQDGVLVDVEKMITPFTQTGNVFVSPPVPILQGSPESGNGVLDVASGNQVAAIYADGQTLPAQDTRTVYEEEAVFWNGAPMFAEGAFLDINENNYLVITDDGTRELSVVTHIEKSSVSATFTPFSLTEDGQSALVTVSTSQRFAKTDGITIGQNNFLDPDPTQCPPPNSGGAQGGCAKVAGITKLVMCCGGRTPVLFEVLDHGVSAGSAFVPLSTDITDPPTNVAEVVAIGSTPGIVSSGASKNVRGISVEVVLDRNASFQNIPGHPTPLVGDRVLLTCPQEPGPTDIFRDMTFDVTGFDQVIVEQVEAAPLGVDLMIQGTCPGAITVESGNHTPNGDVAIVSSSTPGFGAVPAGFCSGQPLSLADPSLVTVTPADAKGLLRIDANVGAPACGRYIQTVDLSSCLVSGVATIPGPKKTETT